LGTLFTFFGSLVSVGSLRLGRLRFAHVDINFIDGLGNDRLYYRRFAFNLISLNGQSVYFFSYVCNIFLSSVLLCCDLVKPFLLFGGFLLFNFVSCSLLQNIFLSFFLGVL